MQDIPQADGYNNVMARRNAAVKKLEADLAALLPQLDEEGLAFLLEQAKVHLHNMEVDRLNREAEEYARRQAEKMPAAGKKAAGDSVRREFSIRHSVSAGCYHLTFGGDSKLFTETEMLDLVRLAKARDSAVEVRRRCFAWLQEERSDVLAEWGISSFTSETLADLVRFLQKTFAIRKGSSSRR